MSTMLDYLFFSDLSYFFHNLYIFLRPLSTHSSPHVKQSVCNFACVIFTLYGIFVVRTWQKPAAVLSSKDVVFVLLFSFFKTLKSDATSLECDKDKIDSKMQTAWPK